MAQRSRKRGRREKAASGAQAAPRASRSEARNEAARAALRPLDPGERPWAVTVSAILATLVGGYNLVSFLLGAKLKFDGQKPGTAGIVLFALVMFTCAGGMWKMRYWAVLGFQALLVLVLLTLAVLLIKVSNLAGLAVCVIGLSFGSLLFYKLVKALSRMQMPEREPG